MKEKPVFLKRLNVMTRGKGGGTSTLLQKGHVPFGGILQPKRIEDYAEGGDGISAQEEKGRFI